MDNYLAHRWPAGAGAPSPAVPDLSAPPARKRSRRKARVWAVRLGCALLCLALLGGTCFWALRSIKEALDRAGPDSPRPPEDPGPSASRALRHDPDWTADELPWGEADPSVELSVRPAGGALSARQVYEKAAPSVATVEAFHASGWYTAGSGVIATADGYVMTNYHILDGASRVDILLAADRSVSYPARLIGFDEEFDLAVLKFDPGEAELTPAVLGDSDELCIGDRVYAIGNPMGYLTGSMSAGMVSALGRDEQEAGSPLGLIQTDAPLNPGNSGGALVNDSGQVVGITCAKITGLEREDGDRLEDSVVLEGMGLAIPITNALDFVNHILATGESWRPAMGITCSAAARDGRRGILVAEITSAHAKKAGLREGDLILTANGVEVASLVELRRVLYRAGAGGELTCAVLRDGEELEVSFTLIDSLKT